MYINEQQAIEKAETYVLEHMYVEHSLHKFLCETSAIFADRKYSWWKNDHPTYDDLYPLTMSLLGYALQNMEDQHSTAVSCGRVSIFIFRYPHEPDRLDIHFTLEV
jgi:hypothetical protein